MESKEFKKGLADAFLTVADNNGLRYDEKKDVIVRLMGDNFLAHCEESQFYCFVYDDIKAFIKDRAKSQKKFGCDLWASSIDLQTFSIENEVEVTNYFNEVSKHIENDNLCCLYLLESGKVFVGHILPF